jgi:hypothetical protein
MQSLLQSKPTFSIVEGFGKKLIFYKKQHESAAYQKTVWFYT